eukprot:m.542530 g.542530  ORF g.542530 m.542530 type:complete len:102 (-) comp57656_c0_seq34:2713-3018(-)
MDSLLEFANGFHWERGTTFMSAPQHVATALGSYIAVSFLLQYLMRSRPAFKVSLFLLYLVCFFFFFFCDNNADERNNLAGLARVGCQQCGQVLLNMPWARD